MEHTILPPMRKGLGKYEGGKENGARGTKWAIRMKKKKSRSLFFGAQEVELWGRLR